MPIVILYTRSHTLYSVAISMLHALWLYSCPIPMAILHGLRFICSSILYTQIHTLWSILHEISFMYFRISKTLRKLGSQRLIPSPLNLYGKNINFRKSSYFIIFSTKLTSSLEKTHRIT